MLKAENKALMEHSDYWSTMASKIFDYLSVPSLRGSYVQLQQLLQVETMSFFQVVRVEETNESDLRWGGCRPEEPDFAFKRRCFSHTVKYITAKYNVKQNKGNTR